MTFLYSQLGDAYDWAAFMFNAVDFDDCTVRERVILYGVMKGYNKATFSEWHHFMQSQVCERNPLTLESPIMDSLLKLADPWVEQDLSAKFG